MMKGRFSWRLLVITVVWLSWAPSRAWAAVSDEQLKAVYLYRFPMLADWPREASDKVTQYCITRESSIGDYLSEIIASKSSSARFIDLAQSENSQTAICHILYVDGQDREHVAELAKRYPHALTIGTGVQFVSLGGMLAFIKVNNRIKPLISKNNVEKSGVRLRAQLLAISELAEEK